MSPHARVLKQRHDKLDRLIRHEQSHPSIDDIQLKREKLEKLRLKDELVRFGG